MDIVHNFTDRLKRVKQKLDRIDLSPLPVQNQDTDNYCTDATESGVVYNGLNDKFVVEKHKIMDDLINVEEKIALYTKEYIEYQKDVRAFEEETERLACKQNEVLQQYIAANERFKDAVDKEIIEVEEQLKANPNDQEALKNYEILKEYKQQY
jgi:dGTP triphosphohydrolase